MEDIRAFKIFGKIVKRTEQITIYNYKQAVIIGTQAFIVSNGKTVIKRKIKNSTKIDKNK